MTTDAQPHAAPRREPSAAPGLVLVSLTALLARLAVLPGATEANMDADSAHFLNVARCFGRGQGFSNPAAWPAWMKPERLPMPESFKEPGYPWLISLLTPLTHDPFRTGQWISMLAGMLLPLVLYALARRLGLARGVSLLAAGLAALNPLLMGFSARVMVESIFALSITLVFTLALGGRDEAGKRPAWPADVATGIALGAAFMLRAQALVSLPAVALALGLGRPPAQAARRFGVALAAATLTALPFLLRNLRVFGTPFHSDVGSFGIWPYVDHLTFSHGLDRPPAPIAFALTHLPAVLHHSLSSAKQFLGQSLPRYLLGNPLWVVPFVIGLLLALREPRRWAFALVYLACTLGFIFAVHWDERYFSSTTPLFLLLTAVGATWCVERLGAIRLWGPITSRHVAWGALLVAALAQTAWTRRQVAEFQPAEIDAARSEAAFLREHLKPDESVMAVTTSFWSWFCDRPSVHLVIADPARFGEVVSRLKVRYAALPTSRLGEFAARYPDGRLPAILVPDHTDPWRDVTVFAVRQEPAPR